MFSKVSFEVHLERAGRWVLESGAEEESYAIETARRMLKQREDATAAKVLRQVTSMMGHKRENEVFFEFRKNTETQTVLTGNPETAPVCRELADCYALPARMAIARLLKMFLDKYQIGALELLHGQSYLRRFGDETALSSAAFFQVGAAQAKKLGVPTQQRSEELVQFYQAIEHHAKDFVGRRKTLPPLAPEDFNASYAALMAHDPDAAKFNLFCQIAIEFQTGMYAVREQKLGVMLSQYMQAGNADLKSWLDEWIADYLCFPEIIDGIIGQQFNFHEFLSRLVHIIQGQPGSTRQADSELLVKLRSSIAENKLPLSKAVLIDRLIREIRTDKPLDRRDPEREEVLTKELQKAVTQADGSMLGGKACEDAIAKRKLRERKRKLRALGLDDVADSLT